MTIVSFFDRASVTITDLPEFVELMQMNIDHNAKRIKMGNIKAAELKWWVGPSIFLFHCTCFWKIHFPDLQSAFIRIWSQAARNQSDRLVSKIEDLLIGIYELIHQKLKLYHFTFRGEDLDKFQSHYDYILMADLIYYEQVCVLFKVSFA